MNKIKTTAVFLVIGYFSFSDSFAQSKKYFFSLGEDKHYSDEFNYAYSKNNLKKDIKKDSIDAYLELYINFRLKVKEAKVLGYDTSASFKKEFNQYKSQLEDSYLSPKKEQEALIKEAYERSLWEISASHILIRTTDDSSSEDTLKAYKKIISIRNRLINGEDFAELAKIKSEDPSAKQNGGNLGYFSVFQMVYPFETAAYNTDIGGVSDPIRTQFGYHIIKVVDKRSNDGQLKVAHIMIRSTSKNGEEYKIAAKKKAFKVDSLLKAGTDWNELCKTYSEDQNSVAQKGVLKPFGRGQIVPEFERAAFDLINLNDISEPIKTQFGWHIIKLIDRVPVGTYDEEKTKLARKIKSDSRSSMPKKEMLNALKEENNFYKDEKSISKLLKLPPSVIIKNTWKFDSLQLIDTTRLFSIGDIQITTGQFLNSFNIASFRSGTNQRAEMERRIINFEDSLVISYEKTRLPIKYPEYAFLVNEYYDGILLFTIMEDSVWNLSMKDSIGLNHYYNTNIDNYVTQVKDTTIFESDSSSVLKKIRHNSPNKLFSNEWEELNFKLLEENNVSPLTLHVVEKDNDEWRKIVFNMDSKDNLPFEIENKWYWIRISEEISNIPLKDIKGKVISDYQSYLDKKWIGELREKHPIKINKKQLKKVYAHFEATN